MEQNCYDFKELISKFIDGELDYQKKQFCEEHIRECPECRHLYENIKVTRGKMSEMPQPEVTPEFMEGLKEKILEAKEEQKDEPVEQGFFRNIPTLSYVFGACIILLIAGFSIYQYNQTTPTNNSETSEIVKEKINNASSTKNSDSKQSQQNLVSESNKATPEDSNHTTSDSNSNAINDENNLDNSMNEKIVPVQDQ